MKVIMDLEADGLLHQATVLHCAVFKDIETLKMYEFIGWSDELETFLNNCTTIFAHNGTTFDIAFLKKVCNWVPKDGQEIIDTLIMSRILNPDRAPVHGTRAPHGVEAWGKRLGRWKPDHTDWSTFSPEMLHRCKEDVEIQFLMYKMLCEEASVKDFTKSIFDKKNYTDHNWALALYQEHRSAQIMHEQEMNGVYFEKEKAEEYVDTLTTIVDEADEYIQGMAPAKPKQKGVSVNKPFKKNGEYTKATTDWYYPDDLEYDPTFEFTDRHKVHIVEGPFSRIEWNELNIGSEKQLKEWLYTKGWEPDEWNHHKTDVDVEGNPVRTSPKLTDTSLAKLPDGIGDILTSRSKSRHRRSQIEGWIGKCRDDHRVPAAANPQGTPTGRMRHIGVANVPKANSDKQHNLIWYPNEQSVFFGTEMRSLFSSPTDRVVVGRDASGLELRCFAHYLNDPAYTEQILSGDIHTYNQEMAGLETRDQAKTFIYAFLYGAGQAKLGSIMLPDGTEDQQRAVGKEMQDRFLAANPNLAKLVKGVKKASSRGWLLGLDGRKLMMRKMHGQIQKNKALNTLLQGAGALIMTNARIWLYDEIQKNPELSGAIKVLDYHDEETWECDPNQSELLKSIMVQSVVQAGTFYNLNCPLDADAAVGKSWAEVH